MNSASQRSSLWVASAGLVLAATAIGLHLLRLSEQSAMAQEALLGRTESNAVLEERLTLAETLLSSLEKDLNVIAERAESQQGSAEAGDPPMARRLDDLLAAFEALENEYALVSAGSAEQDDSQRESVFANSKLANDAMLSYQATTLDPTQEPSVRLSALRMLGGFPEEMNARAEVAVEALELLDLLVEDRDREKVVDCLDGVEDPDFFDSLIARFEQEESEGVRKEMVRALAKGLHLPFVRNALILIAESDSSEKVRKEAARRL